jgi:predicted aldo/keto reductase-like oxidoreductase
MGGTAMEMRIFGRAGLELSVLGFGCGGSSLKLNPPIAI